MDDKIDIEFESDEDVTVTFEPDDALILALNEVSDLREIVNHQSAAIEELKNDLIELKKQNVSRL